MKIEDLGDVIREVDRTICLFHIGEGRIVAFNKKNDHCICQACGSCEIIVQATCLFCNICRSRTPKENEMIDEFFNIVIVTDNNDEYSLKIPKVMMISLLSKDESISTNMPKLVDEEVNMNITTPLKVEFKYNQSTGIVHEIIPKETSLSLKTGRLILVVDLFI